MMKILEWLAKKPNFEKAPDKVPAGDKFVPDVSETYCSIGEFALGKKQFASPRVALDAAIQITGLTTGGFFKTFDDFANIADELYINTRSGDVQIRHRGNTPEVHHSFNFRTDLRFFAPEAVSSKRIDTDNNRNYAAGVLAFMMLTGGQHPLEGSRSIAPVLTPEEKEGIYGTEARFIFDEEDESNRPDPKVHFRAINAWDSFPAFLKDFFRECFKAVGDNHMEKRPAASEIGRQLIRYQNGIIPCECGVVYFTEKTETVKCGWCGRSTAVDYRLSFSGQKAAIVRGNRIYNCQISDNYVGDYEIVAEIVVSPSDINKLGIQNKTEECWEAITSKGSIKQVEPNGIIPVKEGIRFRCRGVEMSIIRNEAIRG